MSHIHHLGCPAQAHILLHSSKKIRNVPGISAGDDAEVQAAILGQTQAADDVIGRVRPVQA